MNEFKIKPVLYSELPYGRQPTSFEFHSHSRTHDPIGSRPLALYANSNFLASPPLRLPLGGGAMQSEIQLI